MSANETRGELSLKLEGEDFVLRPSWEAIQAFEAETGKGVVQLAMDARGQLLNSREVAVIAASCIRAWGKGRDDKRGEIARAVDTERVGGLIMDADLGIGGAMGVLSVLLLLAATGRYTSSGERKPATETKRKATTGAG